jgi:hypothetical protein
LPPVACCCQFSETPRDENPAIFHDSPNVPPDILDDTIFMIIVDPLDITADVLDDVTFLPVPMYTQEVDS